MCTFHINYCHFACTVHTVAPAIMDVSIFNQPILKYRIHKPSMFQTPRAFFAAFETSHETQSCNTPAKHKVSRTNPAKYIRGVSRGQYHPYKSKCRTQNHLSQTPRGLFAAFGMLLFESITARHGLVSKRCEEVSLHLISLHR